ncbi:hypothetical protein [Nesterenkonia ebinurensis]|uniref:hypothetical protein n=1 Tax=Nesterenkonia ebinurensis TaxID=2608252 RepID=UPI00123D715B|nr:hypothetical protein [Nesterenkonia ebinurensis]
MNPLMERIYTGSLSNKRSKARSVSGTMVPSNRILQLLSAAERRDFEFGPHDAPARDFYALDRTAFRR